MMCEPDHVDEEVIGSSHLPGASAENPPGSPVVPPKFQHMVRVLKRARQDGRPRMSRSTLATILLREDEAIWTTIGMKSFKVYSTHAQEQGVVKMGHYDNGEAWIELSSSL